MSISKQKSHGYHISDRHGIEVLRRRGLANGEEATDRKPAVVEPIQVEVPLGADLAESRHAPVATDLRDRAKADDRKLALLFREGFPVGEHMLDLGRRPRVRGVRGFDFLDRVPRGDVAIEMEVTAFELHDAFALDGETLRGDVVVLPVVLTGGDHLLERLPTVNRETEDVGGRHRNLEWIPALSE